MKKAIYFGILGFFASSGWAVTMNFGGNFRTEAAYYNRLGLTDVTPTKTFISGRALLFPNLIIDDHFSLKSQWSLLSSPQFTPNASTQLGAGQGGWVFGDVQTSVLQMSRTWLEWTSDFGVFRIGRMPVSWGYGLLYDAGNNIWDDYQSTLDRLEYRLHLGNVIGAFAYSKGRKLSVLGHSNDQEFYAFYVQYDSAESDVEGGLLYEKQVRSASQSSDLTGQTTTVASAPGNPYQSTGTFPLATKAPYPLSSNVLDLYLKKKVSYFTFGGEVSWLSGDAADYNGDGRKDELNAYGLMLSTTFEYHKIKAFAEFLYASGDANLNANHLHGFVLLHRNRRPGLILGRELLGSYYGNNVAGGSLVVYGDKDTFSGVYYLRPGFRFDWASNIASGIEFIMAQKAVTAPGEKSNLGFEIDLGTDYSVYKNFDLGANFGYLFPGDGLRIANPKGVFAFRTTASLKF